MVVTNLQLCIYYLHNNYYNIFVMKLIQKLILLSSIFALSLTSCDFEKKCYCLESSNDADYHEGKCYQASRSDIVESVFVINLPLNPEANEEDYRYDIAFSDSLRTYLFSMVGGLSGKKIISVMKINDHVLSIQFDNLLDNSEATFGYVRINRQAFKAYTERAKESYLYAYIAIGDSPSMVDRPENVEQ